MNSLLIYIFAGAGTIVLGFLSTFFLLKKKKFIDLEKKKEKSEQVINESEESAKKILTENAERVENFKKRLKEEIGKREERIEKIKQSLSNKEESINKKEQRLNEVKLKIASYKEEVQSKKNAAVRVKNEIQERLSKITGQSSETVKENILRRYKSEITEDGKKRESDALEALKEDAPKEARRILITSMQRLCSPTSVETRAVLIKVPRDDIKGKIVGKDGRNIIALEEELDAAIVFNDLPNTISISAFNLVIRRIAEKTIKKLINIRGGIDENVIKKTIKLAEKETDEELYEIGKKGLEKMGIQSKDQDFIRTVGRLQYRTSYGQNIMKHSMEVGWIATTLGSEIGLDLETCKTAGFLHDLGKAIDQDPDVKDAHDRLTKELMEKYGFPEKAIHAAWTHHDAESQETPEALIVKAADSVSGGRPGARQDSIERYIERMRAIDESVNSFEGVQKSYTMSAGREVRVYVNPDKITDKDIENMATNMAKAIEDNVVYPGKIKIKVIRRTKSLEIAK
ncbi:MAG: Rnase Y domain-containing protein [Nitrospirota bacterium]